MANAAFNTLIGMGTVFAVLALISFLIYLFRFIGRAEDGFRQKKNKPVPEKTVRTKERRPEKRPAPAEPDLLADTELIAVIAAAVAAYEGTSPDGIIVRSVRKTGERKRTRRIGA